MLPEKKISSYWDLDGGKRARQYASRPYGHYKEEIYPAFAQVLDGLGDGIRVLDIGAGPGHFSYEFYKTRPKSNTRFALLELGGALLEIAQERMKQLGKSAEYFQRSYNSPDWIDGLGKFDAIVSNNSIFNLYPELLPDFYAKVYGLLNENGVLLNQQSFAFETTGFKEALKNFPPAFSSLAVMSADDIARTKKISDEARADEAIEKRKIEERMEAARREGIEFLDGSGAGYASLHIPASKHIEYLNAAGFTADCIWRKLEFAVLLGIKGKPFPTS
jgi:SAM-dependent methyltransferase